MLGNVGEKVGVAVLSALILGALALIWQVVTDGGLVRALGGVTRAEVEAMLAGEPQSPVPSGAVVAFDTTGSCPEGWQPFVAGQSRTIVGASFGVDPEPGLGTNAANRPLVAYKYRDHGGVETVTLSAAEMPAHSHTVSPRRVSGIGGTHGLAAAADGGATSMKSDAAGGGKPHENMPPFIALYFCRKI